MLISPDWASPARSAAWARMPRLLGSLFDRTRRTRPRGRARVSGCLKHGTAKTHPPFPRADLGSTFFFFFSSFLKCPGCERKSAGCHGGTGSPTGPVFCAPGSSARRRLVRVVHHYHRASSKHPSRPKPKGSGSAGRKPPAKAKII